MILKIILLAVKLRLYQFFFLHTGLNVNSTLIFGIDFKQLVEKRMLNKNKLPDALLKREEHYAYDLLLHIETRHTV